VTELLWRPLEELFRGLRVPEGIYFEQLAAGEVDYGLVCRATETREIVGYMSLEKNIGGRQISSPIGSVEPSQRGIGIGQFGTVILEHVGRAIGAEVAFYYVTLKTTRQQKKCGATRFSTLWNSARDRPRCHCSGHREARLRRDLRQGLGAGE
jgi:hypothetical protein